MDIHMEQYPEPSIPSNLKSKAEAIETRGENPSISASWTTSISNFLLRCFPRYADPSVQLGLVAFISFLCPGMWNALNGLGGGGLVKAEPANNANVALYSTFAVFGFFAGIATNKLGTRATLSLGGLGYTIYTSSLLCYKHTENSGFLIFAGLQLGLCAGLFWVAQGMVMLSYPTEESKGKYIAWSWMIYNMGAVIGSVIALAQNMHSETNDIKDVTFYVLISLSLLGTVLSLLLCEAKHVKRSDGSRVVLPQTPTWKSEVLGLLETLKHDTYILLLFPMFFTSNLFYPYQFNTFNLATFNIRTRSLNNTLYWLAEIAGSYLAGYTLDSPRVRRSLRARVAMGVLLLLVFVVWTGAFMWQRNESESVVGGSVKKDYTDAGYVGPMFLYLSFGLFAAVWQTTIYWFLGALTNDSRKLANFAGFYKGIQSAGGAVSFRVNTLAISSVNELVMCWALLATSLLIAVPAVVRKVQDKVD
ncbi:MFS general substrate transporter [Dothidotthia symphoricarpi CBS 119687]|uniref:MFS general substrate transporter n=1 Tax=Dothidotthia symphoricarpi CBS 119687 TaxID=1392245 RepID=A0A6A6AGG0_9PLEO|nr:MFS general substrate transporter [Dothidotthia symphoricarpi CBS 119687]KAF2130880.1 MFS general substrate transporter [Dothidotthia symphoricarpi CBS 119687]